MEKSCFNNFLILKFNFIKKVITHITKPANAHLVNWLAATSLVVLFFPQWFNAIPFHVSDLVKETVEWILKGVDLVFVVLSVLYKNFPYKGSYFRQEIHDGESE